jgi:hypothetical protein
MNNDIQMDTRALRNLGWDVAMAVGYDATAIVSAFISALRYSHCHEFADEVREGWNRIAAPGRRVADDE